MESIAEIDLLNSISKTHNLLFSFKKELRDLFPSVSFRFDLSMYTADRKQWPHAPIGISWEINMDELDEILFFELANDSYWRVSSEVSQPGLETIETFFELEFDKFSELLKQLPRLIDKFQSRSKDHLKSKKLPKTIANGN